MRIFLFLETAGLLDSLTIYAIQYNTNRFHVALRLFSNRSQMTSKCGKKKTWHTRRSRVCHWCSYHVLTSSVIYYWIRHTATWNLFVLYNNEKPFLFQNIKHNAKAGLLPHLCTKKSQFDMIFDRFKMKQFHWLLCVAKNCDWSRKIAPLSNLTQALLVEWKLTAKAELSSEIYKSWRKCWKKSSQFLPSEQPWEPKSLDVTLKITGVEKIPPESLWLRST